MYTSLLMLTLAATPADSVRVLDPVVVSATRSETRLDKIPQKLVTISRQDIALVPAVDLPDLLKKTAAVNIIQYPNLSAGIGIRGFRPQFSGLNQRTLLLVDGRPAGATNLATLMLTGVERVEVLKGTASALYGSQAMGGVINVITRRSTGEPGGSAYLDYGSFRTLQAGLSSGGNLTKRLDYDLSFGYVERSADFRIGGDNLLRNLFGFGTAVKNYTNKPSAEVDDRQGDGQVRPNTQLHYYSGGLRLGYQLTEGWRMDVRGDRFEAKNVQSPGEISSGTTDASSKDVQRNALELAVSGKIGAYHRPTLRVFTADESNANYTLNSGGKAIAPYRSNRTANAWTGLQIKDIWTIGAHSVVFGYDYLDASTKGRRWSDATTERAPTQPDYALISSAVYAQAMLTFNRLTVQPGLRYDNSTFDVRETPLLSAYKPGKKANAFWSPNLGLVYQLPKYFRVSGTVGRAFVTTDAYSVAGYVEARTTAGKIAITSGNPDLKNESSVSWDAALGYRNAKNGLSGGITYFSTEVTNRIAKVVQQVNEPLANGDVIVSRTTFVNAAGSRIRGLEAEGAYDFGAKTQYKYSLRVFANATVMFRATEDIVGTDRSVVVRDVMNVARSNGQIGVEYDDLKQFRVRLSARWTGVRKDIDYTDVESPEIEYAPYAAADASASWRFRKNHSVTFAITNITDENYYEKRGYNLAGRAVSLRYGIVF